MEANVNPLHLLMNGDVAYVNEANCLLARLWRLSLYELHLRPTIWEGLLAMYCEKCREYMSEDQASNLKGNLTKALSKDRLAWGKFSQGITVFKTHEARLEITTSENGVRKTSPVIIPPTYNENDSAMVLKVLWQKLMNAYPDRAENWGEYISRYCKTCHEVYGDDASNLRGNLTRALTADTITWNSFYRGVVAMDFESVEFAIRLDINGSPDDMRKFAITLVRS